MISQTKNSQAAVDTKPAGKKGRLRKFGRILLIVFLALGVIAVIAHIEWKQSGNGQWVLAKQVNGTSIYTLKAPNTAMLKLKVTGKYHSKLSSMIKLMRDPHAGNDVGVYDSYIIDSISPALIYYSFKQNLFFPYKPREYVVKSEFSQDPATKAVFTNFVSAPDKLPENDCCFRVKRMNNVWKFTPQPNGDLAYEFTFDADDPGGNFPYFLANLVMPIMIVDVFNNKMPDILKQDKYVNAQVDYVNNL